MKEFFFIVLFSIIIYLGVSTLLSSTGLMGSYGSLFASYNQHYFGYISFVYLFGLLVPLFLFYKETRLDFRKSQIIIASTLLFFAALLFQALLVTHELRGKFGADFVDFLSPYIGLFGLWIFWFMITLLGSLVILDKSVSELSDNLYQLVSGSFPKKPFKQKQPVKQEKIVQKEVKKHIPAPQVEKQIVKEKIIEEEVVVEELAEEIEAVKTVVEPIEEVQTPEVEEEIDTPSYLRKEEKKTILDIASQVKEKNATKEQKATVVVKELEENAKLLANMDKGKVEKPKNFKLPSVDFLQKPKNITKCVDESELDDKIRYLIDKLAHFKIDGDVVRTYAGPVVSTFEFKPAANVKVSKILGLQDDLAMALSAETIRIQAPIPGKNVVGIEIPNDSVDTIYLREILDDKLFKDSSSPLTMALGKDIVGKPFVTDLKKLPHLLIAGTTGSGKSVGINAMILSLLYKNSPDQLRLLMIDPKMLEFSTYNDIPHLLTPVITKPKQAIAALNNMVNEMERRYELMADARTKNIENYNEKMKKEAGEAFPYIVVIIDELADLMMTSGKDVEYSIARLAQKSRACGIHLIVATQRPSVDVVTGLIKANLPSRISYRVGQKIDSKIILDQMGAESLLGRGDMLFTPPGSTGLVRLHAPWATEEEIEEIVEFIKAQRAPNYDKSFLVEESESSNGANESYEELDELYEEAKNVVLTDRKTSISYLQRKLQIGYNRSARVVEQLEQEGVLSAPNAKGMREIL